MKLGPILALVAVAAFAAGAHAQAYAGIYPEFPFCQCVKSPSAYSLAPTIKAMGGSKFCFTLNVKVPSGSNAYCATKADLKKIEINVNSACDVFGAKVAATLNGKPTTVGVSFDAATQGTANATVMRMTQLGLGLGSDGTEICITLIAGKNGGCTTLEALCVPPAGLPKGVCSAAMFDSEMNCCPISTPGALFAFRFDAAMCDEISSAVASTTNDEIDARGIKVLSPFAKVSCTPTQIKVCGSFFSSEEGAKLQDWVDQALINLLAMVTNGGCPSFLNGYTLVSSVAGPAMEKVCLEGVKQTACALQTPDFPKCQCVTKPFATPFAVMPNIESAPGRTKDTTLYCFSTKVVTPYAPTSACGKTSNLLKAEFYASDSSRRKISGVALMPAGATTFKFISATWGAVGEDTVKATPINWGKAQADGGKICLELSVPLADFCLGGSCWVNVFDDAKNCCPLFASSL
ncbi:Perphorin-1 [Tetrabaena socialis]|uniref:Perphorin-1 n=1 Tax=Tetrabaena socialis TaxID=47790 RepID=A0A2J7ZWA7_9CHLO|nr:Perphorin-1 [Tetrabaena socialis]|eukprot:PNH04571.1 Perphorin-1 [Tetrabaena socialis]